MTTENFDLESFARKLADEENRTLIVAPFKFKMGANVLEVNPPDIPVVVDTLLIETSANFHIFDLKVGVYSWTIHELGLPSEVFEGKTLQASHRLSFDWSVATRMQLQVTCEEECKGKFIFLGRRMAYHSTSKSIEARVMSVGISNSPYVELEGPAFSGRIPIDLSTINEWGREIGRVVPVSVTIGREKKKE